MSSAFQITACRACRKNALRAFVEAEMPSGMIISDIGIFQQDGKCWASPPSRPALTREGSVFKRDGKPVYTPIIAFTSKEARNRWSNAVIAAVQNAHPEVFQ